MGTGIGSGIIANGDVVRGFSGNTGEVGHICLDIDGPPCWCGGVGCVEVLAGPAAVVAAARAAGVELPGVGVAEDFAALSRTAMREDGPARDLLQRSARYLAVAAQALANILDLDLIVLTGPSFALAGSLYVPTIREHLDRTFFGRATHPVDVVISPHASEAAAIGGAALVLQSELAPRHSFQRGAPADWPGAARLNTPRGRGLSPCPFSTSARTAPSATARRTTRRDPVGDRRVPRGGRRHRARPGRRDVPHRLDRAPVARGAARRARRDAGRQRGPRRLHRPARGRGAVGRRGGRRERRRAHAHHGPRRDEHRDHRARGRSTVRAGTSSARTWARSTAARTSARSRSSSSAATGW